MKNYGQYCTRPHLKGGRVLSEFSAYGKVNGKFMLARVFRFHQSIFPPVNVFCNKTHYYIYTRHLSCIVGECNIQRYSMAKFMEHIFSTKMQVWRVYVIIIILNGLLSWNPRKYCTHQDHIELIFDSFNMILAVQYSL